MSEWPSLRLLDRHRNVRTLQHLLNHRDAGLEVDGVFGEKTLAAVRAFQRSAELDDDGVVADPVWLALVRDVAMGDEGDVVKAAQVQLLYRRTLPEVDGRFGMKTDISVRRFQVLRSLAADGVVNYGTWCELLSEHGIPDQSRPGDEAEVDPADWRAQLLSKLRPGGMTGPGGF